MASGLDIAAGALGITSIAAQLVQSVWKLKTFCRHVKNAPTELFETIESLEHFSDILQRLAENCNQSFCSDATTDVLCESIRLCLNAAQRVEQVTLSIQPTSRRRRYPLAIKWVLGRKELKDLLQKLTQSKLDLYLAYSLYAESCRRRDFAALRQYLDNTSTQDQIFTQTSTRTDEFESPSRPLSKSLQSQHLTWVASFRLPVWLTRHAWDIAFERAAGCWTMSFQSYQVIPWMSHPAEMLCRTNDAQGLQRLLQERQLCIHDEFELHHVSVLLYAAFHGATDVVNLLIKSGADASCLQRVMHFFPWINDEAHPASLEAISTQARFLHETLDGNSNPFLAAASKDPDIWDTEDRLILLDRTLCLISPQLFFDILGPLEMETKEAADSALVQCSILHMFARQWASQIVIDPASARTWRSRWSNAVEAHSQSSDLLHARDAYNDTPFMRFLQVVARQRLASGIRTWIDALQSAGIDLIRYGQIELQCIQQHPDFRSTLLDSYGFITFSYGAEPEDWQLWFLHPGDSFAGSFWESVQEPYMSMPGSWVADDEVEQFESSAADRHHCNRGFQQKHVRRRHAANPCTTDAEAESSYPVNIICYGCVRCNDEDLKSKLNIRMHRNKMKEYMEQDCWRGATTEIFSTGWVPKFLEELPDLSR